MMFEPLLEESAIPLSPRIWCSVNGRTAEVFTLLLLIWKYEVGELQVNDCMSARDDIRCHQGKCFESRIIVFLPVC
jgi:hypothetical protein